MTMNKKRRRTHRRRRPLRSRTVSCGASSTPAVLSNPNMKLGCAALRESVGVESVVEDGTDTSEGKASSSTRITPNANSASSM